MFVSLVATGGVFPLHPLLIRPSPFVKHLQEGWGLGLSFVLFRVHCQLFLLFILWFFCSASLYLDDGLELPPLEADYFFPSDIVGASAKYLIHSCVWLCLGLAV